MAANRKAAVEKLYEELRTANLFTEEEIEKATDPESPDWDKILAMVSGGKLFLALQRVEHKIIDVNEL